MHAHTNTPHTHTHAHSLHYPVPKDLMRQISEAYAEDIKKKAIRGYRRPEDSLTPDGKIQVTLVASEFRNVHVSRGFV